MTDAASWDRPWRYRVFAYEVKAVLVDEHLSQGVLEDFRDAILDDLGALELLLDQWAPAAVFRSNREVGAPH